MIGPCVCRHRWQQEGVGAPRRETDQNLSISRAAPGAEGFHATGTVDASGCLNDDANATHQLDYNLGAIVGFVGLLIDAVGDFQYSALPNTATFDSIRGLYQLFGAGEILFGLGFLLAFAGLAIGRQS